MSCCNIGVLNVFVCPGLLLEVGGHMQPKLGGRIFQLFSGQLLHV